LIRRGFWFALRNTAIYTVVVTFATFALGIILAMLVNREFKGRGIVRTALLMPWVVPSYVVGMTWGFLWRQDSGLITLFCVTYCIYTRKAVLAGRAQPDLGNNYTYNMERSSSFYDSYAGRFAEYITGLL